MLQSSGFWDCTGEFRIRENCSISGSSIELIKLAVSLCIKKCHQLPQCEEQQKELNSIIVNKK